MANKMHGLVSVDAVGDIPSEYEDSPVGRLLEYHNLDRALEPHEKAELLVGMCMDHRVRLRTPEKFTYVIRTGGGNLRNNEFQVSYTLTVGGVSAMALIGHSNCGMVGLAGKRDRIASGLVDDFGWEKDAAENHVDHLAPMFELGDARDFTRNEAKRLRARYPGVLVAPLLYRVEDDRLYLLDE